MNEIEAFDVVIVGFGPVGATAANMLGGSGLRVAVLDTSGEIYNKPRAIVADHEMLRTLQRCGLPDDLNKYVFAYPGSNYVGVDGEVIRKFHALPPPFPLGWPSSATFIQPELEGLLRRGAAQHANIDIFLRNELVELKYDGTGARLQVSDLDRGQRTLTARYVLGCDGSRSLVRNVIATPLEDLDFDEQWMVVDAWLTGPADLPDISIQYCQPVRPRTFCIGPRNLRRWELKLLPGESAADFETHEQIRAKLREFVDVESLQIWRAAVYHFHALVAQRWRDGCVFLLGDAAHQTPPFSGQGLCSGVRDVANLIWKIRHIEELDVDPHLLDTYEVERKPHFQTVVSRSKEIGKIVGELDVDAARQRDRIMIETLESGRTSPYRTSHIPPLTAGLLWGAPSSIEPPAGTLFVQPSVRTGPCEERLLEDVLANRFLLVSNARGPQTWMGAEQREICKRLEAQRVVIFGDTGPSKAGGSPDDSDIVEYTETGEIYQLWCTQHTADITIVRPDRYVYGVARSTGELAEMVQALSDGLNLPSTGCHDME